MDKTDEIKELKDEEQRTVDFNVPDYLLQHLVVLANGGISMGISLCVGGTIVSGQLIGGDQYFALLKGSLDVPAVNMEVKDVLGGIFDSYAKIYTAPSESSPAPTYIHLKDAKIFMPGQPPMPTTGMLWRGRISVVSGFSVGSFSVS